MRRLKNLIYDLSDILIVLVLIVIIALAINYVIKSTIGIDIPQEITHSQQDNNNTGDKQKNQDTKKAEEEKKKLEEKKKEEELKKKQEEEAKKKQEEEEKKKQEQQVPSDPNIKVNEDGTVTITYKDGESPTELAKRIEISKVFSSADELINKLIEDGLDSQLQSGVYTFNQSMTYEEIKKILFNE